MKTIQEMAREVGWDAHHAEFDTRIERFAALVREDERQIIIAKNAPEIERVNEHLKNLERQIAVAAIKEALAQPQQEQESVAMADYMALMEKYVSLKAAQPQQEPVACVQDLDEVKRKHLVYEKGMDWKDPLYTSPPPVATQHERKPLTDEEILYMCTSVPDYDIGNHDLIQFARAIEAAHGIKE